MSSFLTTGLYYAAVFIFALAVLISVHEFGHFWVARRFGVKVLRFSLGFGKPLWKRMVGPDRMELVIAAIPLGGYVKMLDEREGEVRPEERVRAFNRQPLAVRSAIVAAGPLVNFLFAILAYWVIFVVGETVAKPLVGDVRAGSIAAAGGFAEGDLFVAVDDRRTPSWETARFALMLAAMDEDRVAVQVRSADERMVERTLDLRDASDLVDGGLILERLGISRWRVRPPAVIGQVEPGGAAEAAGLQAGDKVLSADGEAIADWRAWAQYVRARPQTAMQVQVERDGVLIELDIRPAALAADGGAVGRIGAYAHIPQELIDRYSVEIRLGPIEAMGASLRKSWEMPWLMLRVLGRMLVGRASVENLSGPISIAQYAGRSASIGLIAFLKLLAVVSISLGVLNLMPIPLLDGGHLLYFAIEWAKGGPLSEKAQIIGQQIGLVILIMLMGLAFYVDFERLLG